MESIKNKSTVNSTVRSTEVLSEQNVDTDFTLPDYYPEISKILKCLTEINILSRHIKDDKIELGGCANINLLYSDNNNNINSFVHTYPFNKSIEMKNFSANEENSSVSVCLRAEYLNSKATAPRKVELHGSVTLGVMVSQMINNVILNDADDDKVYLKRESVVCSEPKFYLCKSVFIEDDINISNGAAPIEKIIRSCQNVKLLESKVIAGKVVVKSQLDVELIYISANNSKPIFLSYSHPFSQIIDCDGCDEDYTINVKSKAVSLELHPKTSIDGEIRTVNFESKVLIDICGYKRREIEYVSDAFCSYALEETTTEKLKLICVDDIINENYVCKKSLEFNDGDVSEILDIFCKSKIDYYNAENGEFLLKGTLIVNILGVNSQGEPFFAERPIDYEYRYELNRDNEYICEPEVSVVAINSTVVNNGCVDVAVELKIATSVFKTVQIVAISDLIIKDSIDNNNDTAITLYFAKRETVWQIAKMYKASPDKLCEINSVSDYNEICNQIMLIAKN